MVNLHCAFLNFQVGILDVNVCGPSIPRIMRQYGGKRNSVFFCVSNYSNDLWKFLTFSPFITSNIHMLMSELADLD